MKAKVIKQSQILEKTFGVISVKEIFNSPKVSNMSAAVIKLSGRNRKLINTKCNSFYFILEGRGKFNLDRKNFKVEKGDIVYIPKGTVYYDEGKMTMLSFCNPRFSAEQVEEIRK